jgi:hypothetical protein
LSPSEKIASSVRASFRGQLQSLAASVTETKAAGQPDPEAAERYIDAALQAHPVVGIVDAQEVFGPGDEYSSRLTAAALPRC